MINLDNNFWKEYPELIISDELSTFYTADKSKGKQTSSQIMWAIHLSESPESKYYTHPDKRNVIASSFLKDKKFKWEIYKEIVIFYRECSLTDAERALSGWNETMRLRDDSIKEMYRNAIKTKDTDELVKLDKMLANTAKMFDDYKKIKQDYEDEKSTKKGSKIQSMSDTDEM